MSKKGVARIGDPINHGGTVLTGSLVATCDGLCVARVGDKVVCSLHGPQVIITGAFTTYVDGAPVAHVGSKTSCGAQIIAGSTTRFVDV